MSDVETVFTLGGVRPTQVLVPETLAELQSIVRATTAGTTLVPFAGASQRGLGGAPNRPFVAVDLRRALATVPVHEPDDMTADAGAGTTLGDLARVLALRGQYFPVDPPLAPQATVGGVLAVGQSGPLRTRFGLPRDHLLGLTVLRADGELVKAGGRVVKNVTGYDLMRMHCGALGTLGIIVQASLRVVPIASTEDIEFPAETGAAGGAAAERLLRADVRPHVLDLLREASGRWVVRARLEAATVAAARAVLGSGITTAPDGWYAQARDFGFAPSSVLTMRIATVPGDSGRVLEALGEIAGASLQSRPLVGFVRATWEARDLPDFEEFAHVVRLLRSSLANIGGSVVVERLPDAWALAGLDAWGDAGTALSLMRALKAAYDPECRFNSGRFAGGI